MLKVMVKQTVLDSRVSQRSNTKPDFCILSYLPFNLDFLYLEMNVFEPKVYIVKHNW